MSAPGRSWASSEHARLTMRANRSRDTKPEMLIRRELHRRGRRFRVAYRPLPEDRRRTVDIAFTKLKIAVHIDGCFWHGCEQHFIAPKTNPEYWQQKIAGNRARDVDTDRRLEAQGWTVLRFWEHQDAVEVVATIENVLCRAQGDWESAE